MGRDNKAHVLYGGNLSRNQGEHNDLTRGLLDGASDDPNFDWSKVVKPTPEAIQIFQSRKERETRRWGGPMRTVALLVIPLLALASVVVTRVCLSELTYQASEDNRDSWDMPKAYAWLMLWLLIPSVCTGVMSLMVSTAREKSYLGLLVTLWVIIGAVAEAIGQCVLVLYVLPKLDRINSIVMCMGVLILPGLNDVFSKEFPPRDRMITLIGVVLMAGGFVAFLIYLKIGQIYWLAPLSLALCSTPWIMREALFSEQERFRHTTGLTHSIFKTIALFCGCLAVWSYNAHQLDFLWSYGFKKLGPTSTIDIVGIVGLVTSLSGHMFAWWSCSMCFQRVGFALPLTLATPIAFAAMIGYQIYYKPDDGSPDLRQSDIIWRVVTFSLMAIGQALITRFCWRENLFPVPLAKALFKRDVYNAILLEQTLLANRREKTLRLKLRRRLDLGGVSGSSSDLKVETISQATSDIFGVDEEKVVNIMLATTMWHETVQEMSSVLKAYGRIDKETSWDQFVRFEIHILFDDAFDGSGEYNEYVQQLIGLMSYDLLHQLETPYGAQLCYKMPKGTEMFVHLKDSTKIKTRKRWSQVMYLFYFLRYRISKTARNRLDLNNTFIMTTDGDVQFNIPSVQDLLIYMQRNEVVGAVCGRVHPRGTGAVAWVQYFEYALAHWLQKATEQVLGSVMCIPGAFSMYRASALEEVMYIYAQNAVSGREFLQYDQGEDRWLSTLLLQKGWLLQYSASADCYTFCPETFDEFYNQRRRWITSTMANILDLIFTANKVVRTNISINYFFIFYCALLLISNMIAPTVVVMLMASCFTEPLVNTWMLIVLTITTYISYAFICYFCKERTQLRAAKFYTFILSFFMIFILISTVREIIKDPSNVVAVFLVVVATAVAVSAFFHPRELYNFFAGAVYLLSIPSLYVILLIYSLANINNVAWGTREKKSAEELLADQQATHQPTLAQRFKRVGTNIVSRFNKKKDQAYQPLLKESAETLDIQPDVARAAEESTSTAQIQVHNIDQDTTSHISLKERCNDAEWRFWEAMLSTYLAPEDQNSMDVQERLETIREQLNDLRSMSLIGCVGTNMVLTSFYVVLRFLDASQNDSSRVSVTIQGLFAGLILLQFLCMIWHRWCMVMHVVATAKFQ